MESIRRNEIKRYRVESPPSGGAALRGGNWNNGSLAGPFALNLNNDASNSNTNIGFRCVWVGVGNLGRQHRRWKSKTKVFGRFLRGFITLMPQDTSDLIPRPTKGKIYLPLESEMFFVRL